MNNRFNFIICPDCDLLLPEKTPPLGYSISCPRCGKRLRKPKKNSVLRTFVLSTTGLLIYLPAILLPLMTFKSLGFSDSANVIESIVNFYQNDYYFVSLMVFFSSLVFPLLLLTIMFCISLNLLLGHYPAYLSRFFRTYQQLEEWSMVEVYLLGIMITIVKMADSSEIVYHSGIFCFVCLVLLSLAISTSIDKEYFWRLIETKGNHKQGDTIELPENVFEKITTGIKQHLTLCHTCEKVISIGHEKKHCPRCGSKIHNRIPASVTKTWALVLTSVLLLFPANLLPIMEVDFLGVPDKSTILDGIIYFFQHDSFFIGLVIFTASILVPIFKIIGLSILLFSTRPCTTRYLKNKTIMYRSIAFIGRWSMLDIFVIALLTVLVDYGFFTSIYAAPAATYFCLVVASTMFATITFDPRIMWDTCTTGQAHSTLKKQLP